MRQSIRVGPGLVTDDTETKVGVGAWVDVNNVRFWRGMPQVIGGWEFFTTDQMDGICRGLFSWKDNGGAVNVALGTSEALYANISGDQYTITPTADFAAGLVHGTGGVGYGTGTMSNGAYSRPSAGDFFPLTWSFAAYGQSLLANPRGQTIFQWSNDGAAPAVSLGRSAYLTDALDYADQTAADAVWTRGTGWTFDATDDQFDCDGTQAGNSDSTRSVTGLTVGKYYRVEVAFSGRSAGSIAALEGSTQGTTSSETTGSVFVSFKAGATSATVGFRADVDFVGSVDDDFIVYELKAPDNVNAITVPMEKRHAVAYGCNEEASDEFNPRCIRWSDFEDLDDWVTASDNNAGEYILETQGELLCALDAPYGTFVWTTSDVWFQAYLGAPDQTYDFTRLGTNCGLAGPNAAVVFEGAAYWMSRDGGFWTCQPGGTPTRIISPVQDEVSENLADVQDAKIHANSIGEFREIWWHYPDTRDGNENSRYVSLSLVDGSWSAGQMARSAMIDGGVSVSPIAVSPDGYVYYHERGTSANGGAIEAHCETGNIMLSDGGLTAMLRGIWCDVQDQQGAISLTVTTSMYPQGTEYTSGPHTMIKDQNKVDFRASGRVVKLRFDANAAPCAWRLGPINVDIEKRGSR